MGDARLRQLLDISSNARAAVGEKVQLQSDFKFGRGAASLSYIGKHRLKVNRICEIYLD